MGVSHPLLNNAIQIQTLQFMVERGPVLFQQINCVVTRDAFIQEGWLAQIIVNGDDSWVAATPKGKAAYLTRFKAQNMQEAEVNRITEILYYRVKHPAYHTLFKNPQT